MYRLTHNKNGDHNSRVSARPFLCLSNSSVSFVEWVTDWKRWISITICNKTHFRLLLELSLKAVILMIDIAVPFEEVHHQVSDRRIVLWRTGELMNCFLHIHFHCCMSRVLNFKICILNFNILQHLTTEVQAVVNTAADGNFFAVWDTGICRLYIANSGSAYSQYIDWNLPHSPHKHNYRERGFSVHSTP